VKAAGVSSRIEFEIKEGPKGLQAINVTRAQASLQACYDPGSKTLLVGPNEGNAPPDSSCKYIITHELGHYVQNVSFGDQFWTWGKKKMVIPRRKSV
jgi:Zn-dependent membrane protease YugP